MNEPLSDALRIPEWEKEMADILFREKNPADWQLYSFREVDSTMDKARELLKGAKESIPLCVIAETQTKGRGRQGRAWASPRTGLYATFAFASAVEFKRFLGLPLVVGCVLYDYFKSLGLSVRLKWPNDVLSDDGRKLSGILVEALSERELAAALIGIGVNLSGVPEGEKAASIEGLHGPFLTPPAAAAGIGAPLFDAFNVFLKSGLSPFKEKWARCLGGFQGRVVVDVGEKQVSGQFAGLDDSGSLLIRKGSEIVTVQAGHVLTWD